MTFIEGNLLMLLFIVMFEPLHEENKALGLIEEISLKDSEDQSSCIKC